MQVEITFGQVRNRPVTLLIDLVTLFHIRQDRFKLGQLFHIQQQLLQFVALRIRRYAECYRQDQHAAEAAE